MKISVITPSFNQAAYLEKTIQSVLDQNHSNLEYIIIDGGSVDGSVDIIRKYEKNLAYWVSEKDKGQSDAINKGFRKATGDIVGWINSDDYLAPGMLQRIDKEFAKDENIGIVYGDVQFIDENDDYLRLYKVPKISYEGLLRGSPDIAQPGSFYRADALKKTGLLDETLRYVMDYDLWLRLGKVAKIQYVPGVLAYFRIHTVSKTKSEGFAFPVEILQVKERHGIKKMDWNNRIILYRLVRGQLIRLVRRLIGGIK